MGAAECGKQIKPEHIRFPRCLHLKEPLLFSHLKQQQLHRHLRAAHRIIPPSLLCGYIPEDVFPINKTHCVHAAPRRDIKTAQNEPASIVFYWSYFELNGNFSFA